MHERAVESTTSEPIRASRALPAPVLGLQARLGNRTVQRLAAEAGEFDAPAAIERDIEGARGGGRPLDAHVRSDMEQAFGADFGGVRVHQDDRAHRLNRSLLSSAFTSGSDIYFRNGAYQPGAPAGRELLAHELAHVVQQTGTVQTKLTVNAPGDAYEQEADRVARQVVSSPPEAEEEPDE